MIKKLFIFSFLLCFSFAFNEYQEIISINKKMEIFSEKVKENGVSYIIEDEVFLIFNYEYIDQIKKDIFKEYLTEIYVHNNLKFELKIYSKNIFFDNETGETYSLEKGELYD